MANHSIILACKIPWAEEPGGPQSMGSPIGPHGELDTPECLSTAQQLLSLFSMSLGIFLLYIGI